MKNGTVVENMCGVVKEVVGPLGTERHQDCDMPKSIVMRQVCRCREVLDER